MDKYDPLNYEVIPAKIISDKTGMTFNLRSSLLLVKWHIVTPNRDKQLELLGDIEIDVETPFGRKPTKKGQLTQSFDTRIFDFLNVSVEDNLPYKIRFINNQIVTKSQLTVWEYIPYISYNQFQNMPPIYGQDDTATNALITAMGANTAAVIAMASANPTADAIADAIANNSMATPQSVTWAVGTSLIPVLAKSLNTQTVTIKNLTTGKVKIWISDTVPVLLAPGPGGPPPITYTSAGETVELPASSGVYEVPTNLCKSGIYAIAAAAGGSISVTRTYTN